MSDQCDMSKHSSYKTTDFRENSFIKNLIFHLQHPMKFFQCGKKQDSRDSSSRLGVPRESLESFGSLRSPSRVPRKSRKPLGSPGSHEICFFPLEFFS